MTRLTHLDTSSDSEKVSNALGITKLLQRAKEHHIFLSINLPGVDRVYTSVIVDVDPTNGFFALDELIPADGQQRLHKVRKLNVAATLEGITTRFTATLDKIEKNEGIISNKMSLPQVIDYRQRRSYFRARVGIKFELPVTLSCGKSQICKGWLRNLSLGGIGAVFPVHSKVTAGTIAETCRVKLLDGNVINCPLEIRFVQLSKDQKKLILGGAFINLSPQQERLIQRCVCLLERQLIRKQSQFALP